MGRGILKNTGRIFLLLMAVLFSGRLYAAEIVTELSDSRISVGESTELKFSITGKSGNVKPVKFPAIDGLHIEFSGSSRSFQFINGKTWSGTVLSFTITAEKKGEYRIPPFILEAGGDRLSSREVSLSVTESRSQARGGSGSGALRGEVEVTVDTVYVGEPFIMRYYVNDGFGSPRITGFSEQPSAKGFVIKGVNETGDSSGKLKAGSFCLLSMEKGVHQIGGGSVEAVVEMDRGFFAMDRRVRIPFPHRKINVLPIPSNGKPDSFSGDVGEFKIEAEIPSGGHKLFEEIKIPVKVTGRGNLLTLSKLKVENEDGIKIFTEEKDQSLAVAGKDITGTKNLVVTIIPQREGRVAPGRIFISYFNPYRRVYEKAESAPISFEIRGGAGAGGEVDLAAAAKKPDSLKLNYIIVVSAVIFIILAVILLVMWEKKKLRIIKAELKPETVRTEPEAAAGRNSELIRNIETAMKSGDSEFFMRQADIAIGRIDSASLPGSELAVYNSFKDRIYHCRYGGGKLSPSEIDEAGRWILNRLK